MKEVDRTNSQFAEIYKQRNYYAFPKAIQRSIYTTNLIENFNKNLKRGTKAKEQFPNEDALERYVCSYCMDYNQRFSMRMIITGRRSRQSGGGGATCPDFRSHPAL